MTIHGNAFGLSDAEMRVVQQVARGAQNKVAAYDLGIAEATVKVHVRTILRRLGFSNRVQLAVWAVRNGLDLGPDADMGGGWHGVRTHAEVR